MQHSQLISTKPIFLTKETPSLLPRRNPPGGTINPLISDIALALIIIIFIFLLIILFHHIRGPLNHVTSFTIRSDATTPVLPMFPEMGSILNALTPAPVEDPYIEDAWDKAFYRAFVGDPGEYLLDFLPNTPIGSDPDTPPPERPVFSRLTQLGGFFRAMRDPLPESSSSSGDGTPESDEAWPDNGLSRDFEDPEMAAIAARLVQLKLHPAEILGAVQELWPGIRMVPVYAGNGVDLVDIDGGAGWDPMDIDLIVTGLENEDVQMEDMDSAVNILNTLYRLKLVVDGTRVAGSTAPSGCKGPSPGMMEAPGSSTDELVELFFLRP